MAARGPVRAGSVASSVASRTPGSPAPPEQPASSGQVAEPPGKNLWEQICEEYEAELPAFPEGYKVRPKAAVAVSPLEERVFRGFTIEHMDPVPRWTKDSPIPCTQVKSEIVDPKTCSPREYLETFIFPALLPGMASLLHRAKKERCFERKRTKFIACDFLTEWLYNQNPKRTGEPFTDFFSIPFVEQWLKQHPRPPIPLSLLLTEEEAALRIQSFWRAYLALPLEQNTPTFQITKSPGALAKHPDTLVPSHMLADGIRASQVRCDPEIQELRQWQKKLHEEQHIRQCVRIFWAKQEQKVKCKMEVEEEAGAGTAAP